MEIFCPQCGVKGTAKNSYVGRKVKCPKCQEIFEVVSEEKTADAPVGSEQAFSGDQVSAPEDITGGLDAVTNDRKENIGSKKVEAHEQEELKDPSEIETDEKKHDDFSQKEDSKSEISLMPELAKGQPSRLDTGQQFSLKTFTVFGVIQEAWNYTKGAKITFLAAICVVCLISAGLGTAVLSLLPQTAPLTAGMDVYVAEAVQLWIRGLCWFLVSFLSSVFGAGLLYMGIRRVADRPVSLAMIFSGFPKMVQLFWAFLLMTLMIISGFVLFILPGIYLSIGYMLTLPLILDRDMSVWHAMEASRVAIHQVWWQVLAIFIVMEVILLLSAIPLGIGLFWTIPMYVVVFGVIYRALFGSMPLHYNG